MPTGILSFGIGDRGMKLTTHLHLAIKLRMTQDITLLPSYAFMSWRGTSLPLPIHDMIFIFICSQNAYTFLMIYDKGKGKAGPVQARRGPEGSRKLTFWSRNYLF